MFLFTVELGIELYSFLCVYVMVCLIQGNVGLIFTKGDLKEVREEVAKYKVKLIDRL